MEHSTSQDVSENRKTYCPCRVLNPESSPRSLDTILIELSRIHTAENRGITVGIATRYGLNGPGIESRWGARFSVPV